MHRVHWVLFTVLCACVVSVPSSQRFNTRRAHIGRALSKLRTSRRHAVLGASRGNHPLIDAKSQKNFRDGQFADVHEDGSQAFMNPHRLQDKIETLADTDEHFVDYGDEEGYEGDGGQDSKTGDIDEVYYDESFGSDPGNIRIVGQSTESETTEILNEGNSDYDKEEDDYDKEGDHYHEEGDGFDLDENEAKILDHFTESEESLDIDNDETEEDGDDFDPDLDPIQVVGQSTQAEQPLDIDGEEYDGDDGDFEPHPDDIDVVGHLTDSEEFLDSESGEYHGEEADFDSDPNAVRVVGQSTESEQSLYDEDDEYDADDEEFESDRNENEVVRRSTTLDDDEDDGEEDGFDSNLENVHIVGQSAEFGESFEDDHNEGNEEEDINSVNDDIRLLGQSGETEQVNEAEDNIYGSDQFGDEDIVDHEMFDEDPEFDNGEPGDLQDVMVQGQALLLGDSESAHAEFSKASKEGEDDEWAEDELYEPLDKVVMAHYQEDDEDDADEEPFEGDLPVDGMSYDDESRAQENFDSEERTEVNSFDDDLDESEIDDDEDIDPVEHEDELSQDQQESQRSALEIDFNEDIETFDNELRSMIRHDQVNGQSALQDSDSSYSFSGVHQELDSEHEGEKFVYEDDDREDVDYDIEDEVDVARTVASTNAESHDSYSYAGDDGDSNIYLDDDDDIAEDDHRYIRSLRTQASESDPSDGIYDVERYTDDAEDEDVHVDGFAFVRNADADHHKIASDESVSNHDENVIHVSRSESTEQSIPHWEADDEMLSQNDDDYDDEESRWTIRQDSDHSKEGIMHSSADNEELQKRADDDWNEYLLDLDSIHQEQELTDFDHSLSSEHELSDSPNSHWEDTEGAVYDENGRYEIDEEFDINSHSHDMLHDSVKSFAV